VSAFLTFSDEAREIAITGEADFIGQALKLIGSRLDNDAVYAFSVDSDSPVSLIAGKDRSRSAIYLCQDFACQTPFSSVHQLEQAL
ncbi:MAG: hypothetical protein CVV45_19775, partial [Spirochaetae bacterium HGW-Spirochaetae-10]